MSDSVFRLPVLVLVLLGAVAPAHADHCPQDCGVVDGTVGFADLLSLLSDWGSPGSCDFNGSGDTDLGDLLTLLRVWGPCPPAEGACCTAPAVCAVLTGGDCATAGGVYAGDETTCQDSDGDRIPNAFELDTCVAVGACFSGSSPVLRDTDRDGIDDGDEFYGTAAGLDLPGFGLDPCRKDMLLEFDWVYAPAQSVNRNRPHPNQLARLTTAFADAPVTNPDGTTGITLHLDAGGLGGGNAVADPAGNTLVDLNTFSFTAGEYFTIKGANFDPIRTNYFRYVVMCDAYSVAGTYVNSSGLGERPGDDMIVSMGQWRTGDDNFIGNTIMHELGHNLGLRHGGNVATNFKPNYNSIMNYWHQFCGTDLDFDAFPDDGLDYSRNLNAPLDENALIEAEGVTGVGPGVDWNEDGDATDMLGRNINCRVTSTFANSSCTNLNPQPANCGTTGVCDDAVCVVLQDHDDWAAINLMTLVDSDLAGREVIHCLLAERPITVEAEE